MLEKKMVTLSILKLLKTVWGVKPHKSSLERFLAGCVSMCEGWNSSNMYTPTLIDKSAAPARSRLLSLAHPSTNKQSGSRSRRIHVSQVHLCMYRIYFFLYPLFLCPSLVFLYTAPAVYDSSSNNTLIQYNVSAVHAQHINRSAADAVFSIMVIWRMYKAAWCIIRQYLVHNSK